MPKKILYILSSFNKFGGTPKKTLDLMKYSSHSSYLYVWTNAYEKEFKDEFTAVGNQVFQGNYKRNVFKHISHLLKIIDNYNIDLIQTQFFFGELLGGILKALRPNIKIVVAFVGPMPVYGYKRWLLNIIYKKIDAFVYVSEYVKNEKHKIFPVLNKKTNKIIYNGTTKQLNNKTDIATLKPISLVDVAGLVDWKNIQVLIEAIAIIKKEQQNENVYLYVAGDGNARNNLEALVKKHELENQVFLMGYQSNIGSLLEQADIFVHPAYMEGFGIAVAEAMIEGKPIIVANAGALPELINNNETGLIVDAFDANQWADAILKLIKNPDFASTLAKNAKLYAETEFSVKRFVEDYNTLYQNLLN